MVRLNKIYTKTGDRGKTSLCTGKRLYKFDPYFQAIGDVDELNAHIGIIYAYVEDEQTQDLICHIQNDLFDLGADLATPMGESHALRIQKTQVIFLEQLIDQMNALLPPLNSFVLPRGSILTSQVHITRTVCRRAERSIVYLHHLHSINSNVLSYINRLSDLLFVFARFTEKSEEVLWQPAMFQ